MGLLAALLGLPAAPVRGPIRIAEVVMHQAEEAYYDPVTIRQQLEEVARLREDGVLSTAEAEWWEEHLVARLMEGAERERH